VGQRREEWTIDAPKEKVWAVLSDVSTWKQWMPGVANVLTVEADTHAVTEAHYAGSTQGLPFRQEIVIGSVEDEKNIQVIRKLPGMTVSVTYELSDTPSGGTVVIRDIESHGLLSYLAAVTSIGVPQQVATDSTGALENLARAIK